MDDRILTLHPEGKQGVRIARGLYEAVRTAILDALAAGDLPFSGLGDEVARRLPAFDGSIMWYTTTVKLDLEARGLIERLPGRGPQRLRRVG